MGAEERRFRVVEEQSEKEAGGQTVPVHLNVPSENSVIGRIKVRLVALAILSPWWLDWPFNEGRQVWVFIVCVSLAFVPLVHKVFKIDMARRVEKVLDGIVGSMVTAALQIGHLNSIVVILVFVASPADTVFLVPAAIFFRVVCAPVFAAIALFSSSFKQLPWYRVGIRSFEVGAHAGFDLAHQIRDNTVGNWLERYAKRLYQLVRKT